MRNINIQTKKLSFFESSLHVLHFYKFDLYIFPRGIASVEIPNSQKYAKDSKYSANLSRTRFCGSRIKQLETAGRAMCNTQ